MKSKQTPASAGQKSRRRFTKTLAAALVAAPAVAASSAASAQTSPAPREPKAPPNPQTTPTPAATPQQPATPRPSPVAEAYAEVARARFGKHLNDEELARVKRDLEGNVRASERLGATKLKNSDEPDFIFGA